MVTINCVGGIGDILFCEPIFRHFWRRDGVKPIVVIHKHMMWIQSYIDSALFTWECPPEFETGSLYHTEKMINLRYANQIFRDLKPHDHHDLENMMLDKYRILGLGNDLWKTIILNLNANELQKMILGDDPWCHGLYPLLNANCGIGKIKIPNVHYQFYAINMEDNCGYTVIDWWQMIYHAGSNHHVSTSTFFLMQAIKNKFPQWNVPCYIYPRPNEDGLRGISQLKPDFNLILCKQ